MIKKQIELLDPHVIIFCNTGDMFKGLWECEEISKWVYRNNKQVLIDYYHPAVRWSRVVTFFALCAIYQKSLQV